MDIQGQIPQGSQTQTSAVDLIPLEIHQEILSYLEPVQEYKTAVADLKPDPNSERNCTLRSLALVCRAFYNYVFPFRFENILVFGEAKKTACHSSFCKSIVEGDERARTLAKSVKRYVVGHCDVRSSQEVVDRLAIYWKALAHMSNLTELYFFSSAITNDLLRSLVSLPSLKVLQTEYNCSVPQDLDESLLVQFSNFGVTDVRICDTAVHVWDESGDFMSTDDRKMQLYSHFCLQNTQTLYSSTVLHCHILEGLASLRPMFHLHTLNINCLEVDDFQGALPKALRGMPALKTLRIAEVRYHHSEGMTLESPTEYPPLPLLEEIHGPLPLLKALVPGSHVSSVGIAREDLSSSPVKYQRGPVFWAECVSWFKKSLRPINVMDVPMNFCTSVRLATHFSQLCFLKIRPKHYNWYDKNNPDDLAVDAQQDEVVAMFLDSTGVHPELAELEFVYEDRHFSPLDGAGVVQDLYEDSLTDLKLRIPSLQRVAILDTPYNGESLDKVWEHWLGEGDAASLNGVAEES